MNRKFFCGQLQRQNRSASTINDMLKTYASIYEKIVPVGTFASLSLSTDQTNTDAQMRASKFGSLSAKVSSQLSFINSELVDLPNEVIEEAIQLSPEYQHYLEKLLIKEAISTPSRSRKNTCCLLRYF